MLKRLRSLIVLPLAVVASLAAASPAAAQVRYTNTTDGTISESATPCSSPLVRNFTAGAGTVTDIDIGVLLAHTWRADLVMTLQSPSGTRVTFVNGVGGNADNFNVLLSDQNGTPITSHTTADTATSGTVVPPLKVGTK